MPSLFAKRLLKEPLICPNTSTATTTSTSRNLAPLIDEQRSVKRVKHSPGVKSSMNKVGPFADSRDLNHHDGDATIPTYQASSHENASAALAPVIDNGVEATKAVKVAPLITVETSHVGVCPPSTVLYETPCNPSFQTSQASLSGSSARYMESRTRNSLINDNRVVAAASPSSTMRTPRDGSIVLSTLPRSKRRRGRPSIQTPLRSDAPHYLGSGKRNWPINVDHAVEASPASTISSISRQGVNHHHHSPSAASTNNSAGRFRLHEGKRVSFPQQVAARRTGSSDVGAVIHWSNDQKIVEINKLAKLRTAAATMATKAAQAAKDSAKAHAMVRYQESLIFRAAAGNHARHQALAHHAVKNYIATTSFEQARHNAAIAIKKARIMDSSDS